MQFNQIIESGAKSELVKLPQSVLNACVASLSNSINKYIVTAVPDTTLLGLLFSFALWGVLQLQCKQGFILRGVLTRVVVFCVVSFITSETSVRGPGTVPLSTAVNGIILVLIASLHTLLKQNETSSELSQIVSANCKFVFATIVSSLMVYPGHPWTSVILAGIVPIVCHAFPVWNDSIFPQAVQMASLNVLKTLLISSIPVILVIPTNLAMLSFAHPLLSTKLMGAEPIYEFILYKAGDDVALALQGVLEAHTSIILAMVFTLVAPTTPLRSLAQVVATSLLTKTALGGVLTSGKGDPVFTLLLFIVFIQLALVALKPH